MAANWLWQNQDFSVGTSDQGRNGFYIRKQWGLGTGRNLQRVIMRSSDTTSSSAAVGGVDYATGAGGMTVDLFVDAGANGITHFYSNSYPVTPVLVQAARAGEDIFWATAGTGGPIEADITIRKSPPPPGTGELQIMVDLTYAPNIPAIGSQQIANLTHFVFGSLRILTSKQLP